MIVTVHHYLNRAPAPGTVCWVRITDPGAPARHVYISGNADVPLPAVPGTVFGFISHTGIYVPSADIVISNQTDVWWIGDNLGGATIIPRSETREPILPSYFNATSAELLVAFKGGLYPVLAAGFVLASVRYFVEVVRRRGSPPPES